MTATQKKIRSFLLRRLIGLNSRQGKMDRNLGEGAPRFLSALKCSPNPT